MLQELINKQDSFESIRDQIAALLILEVDNQKMLAVAAGLDPNNWNIRIFTERASPWETFPPSTEDTSPCVNVCWDSTAVDLAASNVMERIQVDLTYNIDIYGFGRSTELNSGFSSGDRVAAFEAHRALRLVRNILMSAENTYLQLRGLVTGRTIQSMNSFQPQLESQNAHHVVGARIAFAVKTAEFSPQYVAQPLEYLSAKVIRQETGEVIALVDYDYT